MRTILEGFVESVRPSPNEAFPLTDLLADMIGGKILASTVLLATGETQREGDHAATFYGNPMAPPNGLDLHQGVRLIVDGALKMEDIASAPGQKVRFRFRPDLFFVVENTTVKGQEVQANAK